MVTNVIVVKWVAENLRNGIAIQCVAMVSNVLGQNLEIGRIRPLQELGEVSTYFYSGAVEHDT